VRGRNGLKPCGVKGVYLPPTPGDAVHCLTFLATEIRALLCADAFYRYAAFIVEKTPAVVPPPQAAQP
jgi:hypothetical protein